MTPFEIGQKYEDFAGTIYACCTITDKRVAFTYGDGLITVRLLCGRQYEETSSSTDIIRPHFPKPVRPRYWAAMFRYGESEPYPITTNVPNDSEYKIGPWVEVPYDEEEGK